MIMACGCKHPGQDALHGPSQRVFNETQKGGPGEKIFRCTVCGKEVTRGGGIKKGKKGKGK